MTTRTLAHPVETSAPPSADADEVKDSPQGRILRHVRDAIRAGTLRPGGQLRLRDEFMADFAVSKVTVQRAFNRLAADGFIVARGSLGTRVADRPPNLFRIALVFNESKADVLANRYRVSILAAAAPYDAHAAYTLVPYYGIGEPPGVGDRDRLADDIRHGRLAGLVGTYAYRFWPDDPRLRDPRLAQIHWGRLSPECDADAAPYATLVPGDYLELALNEVVRRGGRRVALLVLSHQLPTVERFVRRVEAAGCETRSHWIHGVDYVYPQWAAPLLRNLFSLPPEDRPDSLIVGDDHLAEQAVAGLHAAGVAGEATAVFHANFPVSAPLALDAPRVGVDSRDLIDASIAALEAQWDADRRGVARPRGDVPIDCRVDAGWSQTPEGDVDERAGVRHASLSRPS